MPIVTDWGKRLMVILACVALAGALGLGWWCASLRSDNKRLSDSVAGLTVDLATAKRLRLGDQQVALRYAKSVASMTTTQKATDAKLQAALAANAPWADQNVPPDVAAAIGLQLPTPTP